MSKEELLKTLLAQYYEVEQQIQELTKVKQSLRVVIDHNSSHDTPHLIPGTDVLEAVSPRDDDFLYGPLPKSRSSSPRTVNPVVTQIRNVLADEGRPLHTRRIYERLQERKVFVGGTDPVNNLSSFLSRNKTLFENVGRGIWGLREWSGLAPASRDTPGPDTPENGERPDETPSAERDESDLFNDPSQEREDAFASEEFDDVPF